MKIEVESFTIEPMTKEEIANLSKESQEHIKRIKEFNEMKENKMRFDKKILEEFKAQLDGYKEEDFEDWKEYLRNLIKEKEVDQISTLETKAASGSLQNCGTRTNPVYANLVPTTCINFKELVLSLLRRQGWTINDVKFSEKGNLESINIKFASEFSLGNSNSPWDPR